MDQQELNYWFNLGHRYLVRSELSNGGIAEDPCHDGEEALSISTLTLSTRAKWSEILRMESTGSHEIRLMPTLGRVYADKRDTKEEIV